MHYILFNYTCDFFICIYPSTRMLIYCRNLTYNCPSFNRLAKSNSTILRSLNNQRFFRSCSIDFDKKKDNQKKTNSSKSDTIKQDSSENAKNDSKPQRITGFSFIELDKVDFKSKRNKMFQKSQPSKYIENSTKPTVQSSQSQSNTVEQTKKNQKQEEATLNLAKLINKQDVSKAVEELLNPKGTLSNFNKELLKKLEAQKLDSVKKNENVPDSSNDSMNSKKNK